MFANMMSSGRDVGLNLNNSVEAASGPEKLSGNLCAVFGWGRDVESNMSKLVEVTGSGLDSLQVDGTLPC